MTLLRDKMHLFASKALICFGPPATTPVTPPRVARLPLP